MEFENHGTNATTAAMPKLHLAYDPVYFPIHLCKPPRLLIASQNLADKSAIMLLSLLRSPSTLGDQERYILIIVIFTTSGTGVIFFIIIKHFLIQRSRKYTVVASWAWHHEELPYQASISFSAELNWLGWSFCVAINSTHAVNRTSSVWDVYLIFKDCFQLRCVKQFYFPNCFFGSHKRRPPSAVRVDIHHSKVESPEKIPNTPTNRLGYW